MRRMTLHLLRFASGHAGIDALRRAQSLAAAEFAAKGRPNIVPHYIHNRRRRADEFSSDSSLYWIIDGAFACRQQVLGFEDGIDQDGRGFTVMLLDPELVTVDPRPRKNFGGWRYLDETQVPPDLSNAQDGSDDMPTHLRQELQRLGLM